MKNKIPIDSNFEPPKPKGGWTWRTLNKNFLQIKKPTTGKGIPKNGRSFGEIYPNIPKYSKRIFY